MTYHRTYRHSEPKDKRSNPPKDAESSQKKRYTTGSSIKDSAWFMHLLYWLAFFTALVFAFFNIAPYARAMQLLFANAADGTNLVQFLASLPIINAVMGVSGIAAIWILGALLWALIQACEVFPIFLQRNRVFLRGVIKDADSHERYAIKDDDDPFLKTLKEFYNRIPLLAMRNARQSALIAYTVDFLICLTVYPPVEGGFSRMLLVLSTGQWNEIDWLNVAALLASLFIVEIMVRFMFWMSTLQRYVRSID